MKKWTLLLLFLPVSVFAQTESQLSVNVLPGVHIPFATDPRYFTVGGGTDIEAAFRFPFLPLLGVRAHVGYSYLPVFVGDGVNFLAAGGGLGVYLPPFGKFSAMLYGSAGYYYGIVADSYSESGGNAFFSGGIRIGLGLTPTVDIGPFVEYRYLVADSDFSPLFSGISVGISNRYNFFRSQQLRIEELGLGTVFPVLYKYYEHRNIGSVTIRNAGAAPMEDIQVSFFVERYMDNPTVSPAPSTLAGGESAPVNLFALFGEQVMDITEATVVSGNVVVSYTQNNRDQTVELSGALRIEDRHAMVWDDDRKAAAYVTYKDPAIIDIGRAIARETDKLGIGIDTNLAIAMATHEALRAYGMSYVIDPVTPFIEYSQESMAVDYIQFPGNTLHHQSGDCDDLSILYASLLQSVGIDTAFITTPGHIYMAFALDLPPNEALRRISDTSDIIVLDDRAWVPVEVTLVDSSFLEAWKTGAIEWNEYNSSGQAEMIPIRTAWETYEPVGYVGNLPEIDFVDNTRIAAAYEAEAVRFVDREIYAQTRELESRLEADPNDPRLLNRMGSVYARYGRLDEATDYFNESLSIRETYETLVNLGNIAYLNDRLDDALSDYERAEELRPDGTIVLLQLSRVHNRLGNFNESTAYFDRLKNLDSDLASRFAQLDVGSTSGARATGQGNEVTIWVDDE